MATTAVGLVDLRKGARIRARWTETELVSLAGMQMKAQLTEREVTGVVRHLRGDDPVAPTLVRLYVEPDSPWSGRTVRPHGCQCESAHVEVDPRHVVGLTSDAAALG
jgi:hypothetical protein